MKTTTIYMTDDGWSFTDREEALKHENELKKEKIFCLEVLESHSYCVNIKAKSEKDALKLFYDHPELYEKNDYEISVDCVEAKYND